MRTAPAPDHPRNGAHGPVGAFTRVATRFGPMHLAALDGALVQASMPGESRAGFLRDLEERYPGVSFAEDRLDPLLVKAARQVKEYADGTRQAFELPLSPVGTPFQVRVWRQLQSIGYGDVRSYRDVAEAIGKPGATRAVGQANHRNPLPILIPCHRVVAAGGGLGGYGGGLRMKQALLGHEGARLG